MNAAAHRADACTTRTHSALQRCLHGAQTAESFGADFKKGTWTFKVGPQHRVAAGHYVLLPAIVAQLAVEQETLEKADYLKFPPPGTRSQRCGDDYIEVSDGAGYELNLWRRRHPDENSRYRTDCKPWLWSGSEERTDENGQTWRRHGLNFVMDDFGFLAKVPK